MDEDALQSCLLSCLKMMAEENKSQLQMVVMRMIQFYQEASVEESEPYKEPGYKGKL